jgi:hypothetical protein
MLRVPSNWLLMVLAPSCWIRREAEGIVTLEKGRAIPLRPFFVCGGWIMRSPRELQSAASPFRRRYFAASGGDS